MRNDLTIHPELNDFNEAELVARVQKGDTEAFTPSCTNIKKKSII